MMLSELVGKAGFKGGDVKITGIGSDSREINKGDIFAAIPGVRLDGRDFIPQAIENGASAILSLPGLPDFSSLTSLDIPVIESENPARAYALLAAKIWPKQPEIMVAITGTNGKSSTIDFLRQIWRFAGKKAASFGTIGVMGDNGLQPLSHTTPDAANLHKLLQKLADEGISHAAMEASSHGLVQHRLDGVKLSAVGFTNLTQDHFDYHGTFENYFQAKARLFNTLARPDTAAVINVDSEYGIRMQRIAKAAGLKVISVGWCGADIKIRELTPRASSQMADLIVNNQQYNLDLPLAGEFQILNAISALGLAQATGIDTDTALEALKSLKGVAGRMQLVGHAKTGAPVFVDYAHTPDGLDTLLRGLRPHTKEKLIVVFGCGGNRDASKRAKMGLVAAKQADRVIVTDDNPRDEKPENIRREILSSCPDAIEIADRAEAIEKAISLLKQGDCLVIAGKGHEQGQIIADKTIPFNDAEIARKILEKAE